VHDSNHFTTLLEGNESAAYAGSAYQSQAHTDWLSEHGIENRLIKRAYRNRLLSKEDKMFNQTHSGVRSIVERLF
jgi:IS5 family transposase